MQILKNSDRLPSRVITIKKILVATFNERNDVGQQAISRRSTKIFDEIFNDHNSIHNLTSNWRPIVTDS